MVNKDGNEGTCRVFKTENKAFATWKEIIVQGYG